MILDHEERFAKTLASIVIERPPLSFWMILIPIIFVFFFMRCQRVINGRREFVQTYMLIRRRALDEAAASVEGKRNPDVGKLFGMSSAPPSTRAQFVSWMHALLEHYGDLVRSDGGDVQSLIRKAYGNRTNYLLSQNRLNQTEKAFNAALKPHLKGVGEYVEETIDRIDAVTVSLRRKSAEEAFG